MNDSSFKILPALKVEESKASLPQLASLFLRLCYGQQYVI